jgi:hypothetical protein
VRNTQYRWDGPSDWLADKIQEHAHGERDVYMRLAEMTSLCNSLAGALDEDTIQDLFQDEMTADGYFKSLRRR